MTDDDLPPTDVDYDTFMARDIPARLRTFNAVSAENRASLVSTHIRRWRGANRARLTPDQHRLTDEWLRLVTPDAYRDDRPEEVLDRAKELEDRSALLFTREDMADALTLWGAYIPAHDSGE